MTQEAHVPNPTEDLEEAAQGHDMFRAPGRDLMFEEAREAAEEARWLPTHVTHDWPAVDMRRQITARRIDLFEAMQRLESANSRAAGQAGWVDEMRQALQNLDRALDRHVTEIEADGGLFGEVLSKTPHLAHAIEDLREEHEDLVQGCRAALAGVDGAETDTSRLRRKVLGLLGRLAVHRQSGAELLYDAYNIDLAGGD